MYIKIQKSLYTIPTAHKCCGDPSLFVTLRAGHTAPSSADAGLPARRRSAVLPTAHKCCGDPSLFVTLRAGHTAPSSADAGLPARRRSAVLPTAHKCCGDPFLLLRSGVTLRAQKTRRAPLCGFHRFDRQTVFASSSALTIATPADAPMRVAPASIMARAVA